MSSNTNNGTKETITKQQLKERIEAKLVTRGVIDPLDATVEQLYQATVQALKDIMLKSARSLKRESRLTPARRCATFAWSSSSVDS